MRNVLLLTKVFLKTGGNAFASDKKNKKKSAKVGNAILYALLLVCFFPLMFLVYQMVNLIYEPLKAINQEGTLMVLILSIVSITIFVFSMFSIASVLFFSKDIEYLLPMPFKPREITMAKFLYILLGEYLVEAIFLIPVFAVWVMHNDLGILFYVNAVIIFLITPVVPILLSAIIMMPIMRFSGLVKHKDIFTIFGSIIGIVFAIGINVVAQNTKGGSDSQLQAEMVKKVMQGKNGMIDYISTIFVNVKSSAKALVSEDIKMALINLLITLVIVAAALAIYMILSDVLYLKGAMNSSGSVSKKKKISSKEFEKGTAISSPTAALAKRELKLIFRTPIYLMNCAGSIIIMPLCFIPMMFSGNLMKQMPSITNLINSSDAAKVVTIIILYAVFAFMTSVSPSSATAISREGENIFISKYLPVSYKKQLDAKLIVSIGINFVGSVIVLIIGTILFKFNVVLIIYGLIFAVLITSFTSIIGLLIDVMRPKLSWNTEEQAVKQNINSMISFLISAVLLGSCTLPSIFLLDKVLWINALALIVLLVILNVSSYYILSTYGVKRFAVIE